MFTPPARPERPPNDSTRIKDPVRSTQLHTDARVRRRQKNESSTTAPNGRLMVNMSFVTARVSLIVRAATTLPASARAPASRPTLTSRFSSLCVAIGTYRLRTKSAAAAMVFDAMEAMLAANRPTSIIPRNPGPKSCRERLPHAESGSANRSWPWRSPAAIRPTKTQRTIITRFP